MLQIQFADFGDKMLDTNTAKIVGNHSFWGAIIMALPLFGFDWIIFAVFFGTCFQLYAKELIRNLMQVVF